MTVMSLVMKSAFDHLKWKQILNSLNKNGCTILIYQANCRNIKQENGNLWRRNS